MHRLGDSDSSAFGTPDGASASNNILCMLSESERSLAKHWRRLRQIETNYFRRFRVTVSLSAVSNLRYRDKTDAESLAKPRDVVLVTNADTRMETSMVCSRQ